MARLCTKSHLCRPYGADGDEILDPQLTLWAEVVSLASRAESAAQRRNNPSPGRKPGVTVAKWISPVGAVQMTLCAKPFPGLLTLSAEVVSLASRAESAAQRRHVLHRPSIYDVKIHGSGPRDMHGRRDPPCFIARVCATFNCNHPLDKVSPP